MKILELGAEGGSIFIVKKKNGATYLYDLCTAECFDDDSSESMETFRDLTLAWDTLTEKYTLWAHLLPIHISSKIQPLVRKSLERQADMNEFQKDKWLKVLKVSVYSDETYSLLIEKINNNAYKIISNLDKESISVYEFLQNRFNNSATHSDHLFQFVFRSFYRLDNAGLSKHFKEAYFSLLEKYKNGKYSADYCFVIKDIVYELAKYPTLKQEKSLSSKGSLQFSFATKLLNIISPAAPIYDSEVRMMLGFKDCSYIADFEKRLDRLCEYYKVIQNIYESALKDGSLEPTLIEFNYQFKEYSNIPSIKKLDFIFWSAGKLKSKGKL